MDEQLVRAKQILGKILYPTVVTAQKDGKPWNSPLAYFRDVDLNLYWFSDKNSVHSQNVRANPHVFIVIYDSTVPEGTGQGVYIEAVAEEVNDKQEVIRIASLQTGGMTVSPGEVLGDGLHRFYKATPKRAWLNDDEQDEHGNYVKDIRRQLALDELVAICCI